MLKNRIIKVMLLSLTTIIFSNCAYINISMPLDENLDKTELGSKVGEASIKSHFWLISTGDASTKAAADNGGITTINHADRKVYSVFFGIYSKITTVVYGD